PQHPSAVGDFPAPVRLPTGGAVGALRFAVDDDLLLILAAVGPVARLIGVRRRHRAGMAAVRILPGGGTAPSRVFERLLRLRVGVAFVVFVHHVADSATDEAADQGTGRDPGAVAAQSRTQQATGSSAAEPTDRRLRAYTRIFLRVLAAGEQ